MPQTPSSRPGRSLKERLEVARRMTAEQQRAAREAEPSSRRRRSSEQEQDATASTRGSRKKQHASAVSAKREQKSSGGSRRSGPKTRTASKEEIEQAKRLRKGPSLPSISLSLGTIVAIGVVCVLVATLVILYPVGQRYYHTVRDEQRLEAELAAVEERNKAIDEQNKALETDEGVENTARRELGWTKEGEAAAVVTNAGDSKSGSSALPDQIDPAQIKAPSTWYYNILDAVFFYRNETPSKQVQDDEGEASDEGKSSAGGETTQGDSADAADKN